MSAAADCLDDGEFPFVMINWEESLGQGSFGAVFRVTVGGLTMAAKKFIFTVPSERFAAETMMKRESRSLAQLAFPLMSAQHAITEADEEGLMSADSAAEIFEHSSQSRRDLLAAFSSGDKTRSGSSSTTDLGSSSIDSTTPYSLLGGFGSREG